MFRLISSLFITFFLVSCASYNKQVLHDDGIVDVPGNYQYAAWRPVSSAKYGAINQLLTEVDTLIENKHFDTATDKLERVLRIQPKYAAAWSRLSWLALQMNLPERSTQMAKRSNNFAFSDADLRLLNWSFIRDASKAMHDEESYYRAIKKLKSLNLF